MPFDVRDDALLIVFSFILTLFVFVSVFNMFADKEVFADYEFLGWYASKHTPQDKLTQIHQLVLTRNVFNSLAYHLDKCTLLIVWKTCFLFPQMKKDNERPLLLLLDPTCDPKEIPVSLFEEEIHVAHDHTTPEFVRIPFRIQPDESERITAEHCASLSDASHNAGSHLTPAIQTLRKAVVSLSDRVNVSEHVSS